MSTQSSVAEERHYERFEPPKRVLLGPGPSPVDDRVLSAMAAPVLGHLDPLFLQCMDDVQSLLRYVFETENRPPASGIEQAFELVLIHFV